MVTIGIKVILIFAKLLGGICLAAVTFSTVLILLYFLTLFYFFYRLIWLFSTDGTFLRMERKYKCYMERVSQEGLRQRATLSGTVDQENIEHLVMLVNEEIKSHKAHLELTIAKELQNLLSRCRYTKNFNKVLQIHKIVAVTDVSSLNSALRELLDEC